MYKHIFTGKWITDDEFAPLSPREVFHRENDKKDLPCDEHLNRHILFRKNFELQSPPSSATLYITADDCYKLYINGRFIIQGPAPAYPQNYGYNAVNVSPYLRAGQNTLAVHTLYQGLINRVWVSGDNRHGLLCDLVCDGRTVVQSDESFLTRRHTAYSATGTAGYKTQFLETYDSRSPEVGFSKPNYDDSCWPYAKLREHADYVTVSQPSYSLVYEDIKPVQAAQSGDVLTLDFGKCYVGYLRVTATGKNGSAVTVRCAQELESDGSLRWKLRANCAYEETWILSGGEDTLNWYDYKSFRYAELILPDGCEVAEAHLVARHYPFALKAKIRPEYEGDEGLRSVWELCVNSQKYGVQEMIHDCMEREKGFYIGDGCYTTLANLILTGDDSMMRKLLDDAFFSSFITDSLMSCLNCSHMQEIAEYPLMLAALALWHYRLTGDRDYLAVNYRRVVKMLDIYRRDYEQNNLLGNLDKWCVVEWPRDFRDGYDVDLSAGKICREPHVVMNAHYIEAVRNANLTAKALGLPPYRDLAELTDAFTAAFYDPERNLFTDSLPSSHISYIGNVFAFAYMLCPDEKCERAIMDMIKKRGITAVSMFGAFPLLEGLVRRGETALLRDMLGDEGAWLRILREGGTTTFEGWGKDTKKNISLFHLALTYGAVFLADIDREKLFSAE